MFKAVGLTREMYNATGDCIASICPESCNDLHIAYYDAIFYSTVYYIAVMYKSVQ